MFNYERRKNFDKATKLKYSLACFLLIILVIISVIAYIESATNNNNDIIETLGPINLKPIPKICLSENQQNGNLNKYIGSVKISNVDIWVGDGNILYNQCLDINNGLITTIKTCTNYNTNSTRKLILPSFIDMNFNIYVKDEFESRENIQFTLEDKLDINNPDFLEYIYENSLSTIHILSKDIEKFVFYKSAIYDLQGFQDTQSKEKQQEFGKSITMHLACEEEATEYFLLLVQKMTELMSLEKEWCLKMKPYNSTYYDSIEYGNIEKNYDIDPVRIFFNKNVVESVECSSFSNWKAIEEIEEKFDHKFNIIINPPFELIKNKENRDYLFSLNFLFNQDSEFVSKSDLVWSIFNDNKNNVYLDSGEENNIVFQASKLIYYGIPTQKTLSLLTQKASNLLQIYNTGIDGNNNKQRILKEGQFADFSVWETDPFEGFTKPVELYSKGEKIYSHEKETHTMHYFSQKQIDVPKEISSEATAIEEYGKTHYINVFGQNTEMSALKLSRNDFFRIYNTHSFVYIAVEDSEKRKMLPTKNIRHDKYVLKNVNILDVDQKESNSWIYENCLIHVERGRIKCINCAHNDAGMYHDQCVVDYTEKDLVVFDFEIYFSLNENNRQYKEENAKKSTLNAIAFGAFIGTTTRRIKSKAIDLDIESLIKNIEQSASVEIRDDTKFMTRSLNSSWEEAVQSIVVNAQVSNFIGGQSVVFETNAKNIEEGLIIESFTIHMTMEDNEDFSIGQQFAILRRLFQEADAKRHEKMSIGNNNDKDQLFDDMTVFEKIISKKYSLSVTVDDADAISNLIKMKMQYGFHLIIYGALEAYRVVEEIKLSETNVVFKDIGFTKDKLKQKYFQKNIEEFKLHNIDFGFTVDDENIIYELRWRASKLLHHGLSYQKTLASITTNIKKIFGMPQNYGSIVVGQRANIAVFDNDPLSFYGKPLFLANGNLVTTF